MSEVSARFQKQYRLLQRNEFHSLSVSKNKISGRFFLVVWDVNNLTHSRLGITASRKSGSSVRRNRVKRCVREYFRQYRYLLPYADLNVIVRRQAAEQSSAVLFLELQNIFLQIGSRICCHEPS